MTLLSFLKMALIAVLLPGMFFFWARPGLISGELSPVAEFAGVFFATALPVIALHWAWFFIVRRRALRSSSQT